MTSEITGAARTRRPAMILAAPIAAVVVGMAFGAFAQPPGPPAPAQPVSEGAQLFQAKCAVCHSERGWATVVLARRTPPGQAALTHRQGLSAAFTRAVVRHGLGDMPGFTPTDITDAQLAALAAWLEH